MNNFYQKAKQSLLGLFFTPLSMKKIVLIGIGLLLLSCQNNSNPVTNQYLNYEGKDDKLSGGVKMIPITTSKGTFNVWTKRIGNNPTQKSSFTTWRPGAAHDYFAADSYFPKASIEYYYYDQLGNTRSDNPDDLELWTIDRFVDEG